MDWQEWFEQADDQWYEETMLRGLVSAYAKMECKERLTYVAKFVPDINNWAVCDCFCSTLKDADKYQTEYWDFIETYFTSNKEYEARFAAVMLLGHFVKREYLKESIRRLESISQQGYYAKMAVAWFKDTDVAVYGGGNTAVSDALFLSDICESVTVVHRRAEFRADTILSEKLRKKSNIRYELSSEITALCGKSSLQKITFSINSKSLHFFFAPNSQPF